MLDDYVSVEARELLVGDIIIHIGSRFTIEEISFGKGAGSFDFGEYISVKGKYTRNWNPFKTEKFWLYRESPILLEKKVDEQTKI